MSGPKSPAEIEELHRSSIPGGVFDVVNELLVERSSSTHIRILQEDIVSRILARGLADDCHTIFMRGWLDFESAYRAVGWGVTYDKPGYGDGPLASFTFRRSR